MRRRLLGYCNAKTVKGEKYGYRTAILYLSPERTAGGRNLCPYATAACKACCLNTAGRGTFDAVQAGRLDKTRAFLADARGFVRQLDRELSAHVRHCRRTNMQPLARLNGTSDVSWEAYGVMARHPRVQFYDYTKNPRRMARFLAGGMPRNYHLTFSWSGENRQACYDVLNQGGNVAIPFHARKRDALPQTWEGYRVIDGDQTDLRLFDGSSTRVGCVIGVRAKGRARYDTTGFVVSMEG